MFIVLTETTLITSILITDTKVLSNDLEYMNQYGMYQISDANLLTKIHILTCLKLTLQFS